MNVAFRFLDGPTDWGWINKQVPILRVEDTSGIVAINTDTGELIAACVMDNWSYNSVQCHIMVNNMAAIRHGFIVRIADYVFTERGCKFIYGMVPSDRVKAKKLNKHIGFTVKSRLEEGYAEGVDYLIMELKKENCPYVTNQEISHG